MLYNIWHGAVYGFAGAWNLLYACSGSALKNTRFIITGNQTQTLAFA